MIKDHEVITLLDDVFGGDTKIMEEWLFQPLPVLNGRTPIELFDSNTPKDRKELVRVLNAIKYGDFP